MSSPPKSKSSLGGKLLKKKLTDRSSTSKKSEKYDSPTLDSSILSDETASDVSLKQSKKTSPGARLRDPLSTQDTPISPTKSSKVTKRTSTSPKVKNLTPISFSMALPIGRHASIKQENIEMTDSSKLAPYSADIKSLSGRPIIDSSLRLKQTENVSTTVKSSQLRPYISSEFSSITSSQPGPSTSSQPGPSTSFQPGPSTSFQPGPSTSFQPGPSTSFQPGPSTSSQPGPSTSFQLHPSTSSQLDPAESFLNNLSENTTFSQQNDEYIPDANFHVSLTSKTQKELYLEEESKLMLQYQFSQEYDVRKKIAERNLQEKVFVDSAIDFIIFSAPLQIISKDVNEDQKEYALTAYIHAKDLLKNKVYFNSNMPLFISPNLEPMSCNVFALESIDISESDDYPVHYGSFVRIKVLKKSSDKDVSLYLTMNPEISDCYNNLILQDEPNDFSNFQLLCPSNEQQNDIIQINEIVHIKNIQTGYYMVGQTKFDMYNICGEGKAISCTCIFDDERSLDWRLFVVPKIEDGTDKMGHLRKISSKNDSTSFSNNFFSPEICTDISNPLETPGDFLPRPPPSRRSETRFGSKQYLQSLDITATEAIRATDLPPRPASPQIGSRRIKLILKSNEQPISKERGDFLDQTSREHDATLAETTIKPDKIVSSNDSNSAVYSLLRRYKYFSAGDKYKMTPSPSSSQSRPPISDLQKKDVPTRRPEKNVSEKGSIKGISQKKPDENLPFLEEKKSKDEDSHTDKNTLQLSESVLKLLEKLNNECNVASEEPDDLICLLDRSRTFRSASDSCLEERPKKKIEETDVVKQSKKTTDIETEMKLFLNNLSNFDVIVPSKENFQSEAISDIEQEIRSLLILLTLDSLKSAINESLTTEETSNSTLVSRGTQTSSPLVTPRSETDESYTTAVTNFDSCEHIFSDAEEDE